jgi:hypothetical protein
VQEFESQPDIFSRAILVLTVSYHGLEHFELSDCHCSLGIKVDRKESPDLRHPNSNAIAPPENFIAIVLDLTDVE